jgi:hypothetical protein
LQLKLFDWRNIDQNAAVRCSVAAEHRSGRVILMALAGLPDDGS